MSFQVRIRKLREKAGLSAAQLANKFNKTEGAVRMWETGRAKPDVDTLVELSKLFSCTTDYLLGVSDIENNVYENEIKSEFDKLGVAIGGLTSENRKLLLSIHDSIIEAEQILEAAKISTQGIFLQDLLTLIKAIIGRCKDVSIMTEGMKGINSKNCGMLYKDHYENVLINSFAGHAIQYKAMSQVLKIFENIQSKSQLRLHYEYEALDWIESNDEATKIETTRIFESIVSEVEKKREELKAQLLKEGLIVAEHN